MTARPYAFDRRGKLFRTGKAAAIRTIRANKIRIAEAANRAAPVIFLARPEIAARKAAKNGGAARLRALALQSEKYFLHRIFAHVFVPLPASLNTLAKPANFHDRREKCEACPACRERSRFLGIFQAKRAP